MKAKTMPDVEVTIQVAQDRKVMAIELAALGQPSQRLILELNELDTRAGSGNLNSVISGVSA
jgi:hypothetical protein